MFLLHVIAIISLFNLQHWLAFIKKSEKDKRPFRFEFINDTFTNL